MVKTMAKGLLALAFVSFEAAAQFCPGLSPWVFTDVPSNHPFCTDITWMAERGVTVGCSATSATQRQYCPDQSVRRDQMAAFMHRLSDALFPTSCAAGQMMKWNGLAWACADDNLGGAGGGGTVSSVAASTGLAASPNPITGAGTLSVAPSYRLPQSCATNQIPKWNGSAWICATGAGTVTSLSQGSGIVLTPNPLVATGTIAADTTYLQRRVSGTCSAGASIRTINSDGSVVCESDGGQANAFVQGGNAFNAPAVLGTNDSQPLEIKVANTRVMRYEITATSPNLIGGHPLNAIGSGLRGTIIAGGGVNSGPNLVYSDWSTVGGGARNEAGNPAAPGDGEFATVGGGDDNSASAGWSTVGGGFRNTASGFLSTVAGGSLNGAHGAYATVPGGLDNVAPGYQSFAAGTAARANYAGCFVYGDASSLNPTSCFGQSEIVIRGLGGFYFWTAGSSDATYSGARLATGTGAWAAYSDRNGKDRIAPVDAGAVLDKLVSMPIATWQWKNEPGAIRHMGPMAQDFHHAFGLGDSDTQIVTIDADGVALAAIQGLNAKVEQHKAEIAALRSEMAELRRALQRLAR